jgi:hypothetical protein
MNTIHGRKPMNSGAVHEFSQHKKQLIAASCKPVVVPQLIIGPTSTNLLLELKLLKYILTRKVI